MKHRSNFGSLSRVYICRTSQYPVSMFTVKMRLIRDMVIHNEIEHICTRKEQSDVLIIFAGLMTYDINAPVKTVNILSCSTINIIK